MKLTVDVRAAHIALGKATHAGCCPIALALRDAAPEMVWTVGDSHVSWHALGEAGWHLLKLPLVARMFIQAFDGDQEVAPITFALEVPGPREGVSVAPTAGAFSGPGNAASPT